MTNPDFKSEIFQWGFNQGRKDCLMGYKPHIGIYLNDLEGYNEYVEGYNAGYVATKLGVTK